MLSFALDGITSFSVVPLRLATWLGAVAGLVGLATATWAFIEGVRGHTVPGWTTIMIFVALGSCAQLLMTGILGEYIGRIYEEVKRRPLYLVGEEVNLPTDGGLTAPSRPKTAPP
jgi:dolichol-phosphate mannosyltransferase